MKRALAVLILAPALVGCTAIGNLLHHETDETFTSTAELGNWIGDADWVPADATEIRVHSSTNGMVSVVRATTPSELTGCTEVERQSLWAFSPGWEPTDLPAKAWACGDWDVVPVDGGWFGWNPNDPDEAAAAEESASLTAH
jgi:hypothetical protein